MNNDEIKKLQPWHARSFPIAQGAGGFVPPQTFQVSVAFPTEAYVSIPAKDRDRLVDDSDKCVRLKKENDWLRCWLGRIGTSSGYSADQLQDMARRANNGDDPYDVGARQAQICNEVVKANDKRYATIRRFLPDGEDEGAKHALQSLLADSDECVRLRAALEFYADERLYGIITMTREHEIPRDSVFYDKGEKAREALKGGKG